MAAKTLTQLRAHRRVPITFAPRAAALLPAFTMVKMIADANDFAATLDAAKAEGKAVRAHPAAPAQNPPTDTRSLSGLRAGRARGTRGRSFSGFRVVYGIGFGVG